MHLRVETPLHVIKVEASQAHQPNFLICICPEDFHKAYSLTRWIAKLNISSGSRKVVENARYSVCLWLGNRDMKVNSKISYPLPWSSSNSLLCDVFCSFLYLQYFNWTQMLWCSILWMLSVQLFNLCKPNTPKM